MKMVKLIQELLRQQILQFGFEYTEYTIGAVIHNIATDKVQVLGLGCGNKGLGRAKILKGLVGGLTKLIAYGHSEKIRRRRTVQKRYVDP